MENLENEYRNLQDELAIGAVSKGITTAEEFFTFYSEIAAENGDSPDLEYCPILKESKFRIDGYAFDIPEGSEGRSGDLHLAICLFAQGDALESVNAKEIDQLLNGIDRFVKTLQSPSAFDALEQTSNEYRLLMLLRDNIARIARIRVLILTNKHLRTRRTEFKAHRLGAIDVHTNILDFARYVRISSTGGDPVEINLAEDFGGGIPCLPASVGSEGYQSYLFAFPGSVLADIFAQFGNRLLEQNVRTYLQARTNVNKGILKTIAEEPSMFFAYNNGLTATASGVDVEYDSQGHTRIAFIRDFQIVNGGQTTASLLYARDAQKLNLDTVYAQVKLSVVNEEDLGKIVPNIARYANTQNKVSDADLASNSPAQIQVERLFNETVTPLKPGALHSVRWFYERTRGQYKNLFSYKSAPQRKKLEAEYPKWQLIDKTDLAKFELAFEGLPHIVSGGAQKSFSKFRDTTLKQLHDDGELTEVWFKKAIGRALVFKTLDREIAHSDWYTNSKGLKAQTVAYTAAAVTRSFLMVQNELNFELIWRRQDLPDDLLNWMLSTAKMIHRKLNDPPGSVKNPSEYCKKEFCWAIDVTSMIDPPPDALVDQYGISIEDAIAAKKQGRRDSKRNKELDFEIGLAQLIPKAEAILREAEEKYLASENNRKALNKLKNGKMNFSKSEINALKNLFQRLHIDVQ
jgi:hypothetical protein